MKNNDTSGTIGVIVWCATSLGETQMQYWLHSNTNTTDAPNRKGFIYLGNDWYQSGDWQHFQRDVEADFLSLYPAETFAEVDGLWFSAADLRIDDITVSPAALKTHIGVFR